MFDKILSIMLLLTQSIYHSQHMFYDYRQKINNKNGKKLAQTFWALHLSLLVYSARRSSTQSSSVQPSSLIVASVLRGGKINNRVSVLVISIICIAKQT